MPSSRIFNIILFLVVTSPLSGQEENINYRSGEESILNVFIRGGFYGDLKDNGIKPFISGEYADLGLKLDYSSEGPFKAFGDIRFRYGSEFNEPVSQYNIREAFAEFRGKRVSFSAGKRILKWGRADFTNPTSKLNPQNYISRSPDREDMDLGNIVSTFNFYPCEKVSLLAVVAPLYSPSVLIIDPIPLPDYVTIMQLPSIITGKELFSYGLKADLHLKGFDAGISWFEGYDPMPGTALDQFTMDLSGPVPVISAALKMIPYKVRVTGFDFETSAGRFGIRGEAAWSNPSLTAGEDEYIPFPEIKWAAGSDAAFGNIRITGEYSGKYVLKYSPAPVDPIIGTEPDMAELISLMMTPGFIPEDYIREQAGAFNRLYNYQLEKTYHSAGLRIEGDLLYGKLLPSVFTMYNFTAKDLLLIPEIRWKPADGLTISIGAEIYNGRKGSLYDIVDDFMTSIYIGLRADF